MADTRHPARPRRETSPATLDLLRRAQNGDRVRRLNAALAFAGAGATAVAR